MARKPAAAGPTALEDLRSATDDESIISFITTLYHDEKKRKRPFAIQWYYNLAFFLGHQWTNLSPLGHITKIEDSPEYRVHRTENEIMPRVKRIVSKATLDPPIMECVPMTLDEADKNSADGGTQFLKYHQYEQDFASLDVRAMTWAVVCSKGFYKIMWDPSTGPLEEVPRTQMLDGMEIPEYDKDLQPIVDSFNLGEIEVEVMSPFEGYPIGKGDRITAPGITGFLHVVQRSVRHIHAVYDVLVEPEKKLQDTDDVYRDMAEQLGTIMGGNQTTTESRENQEPAALVYEYWEKPSKKHEKGRLIVVAGDKVLKNSDLPYDHHELPFAEIEEFPVPGRYWPMTTVEQAIPIQKEINILASKIEEHTRVMAFPKLFRFLGDGIEEPWTNEAGQEFELTSRAMIPESWSPPPLSQDVYLRLPMLREHLDDIFSIHEASRGQVPSGVKSGVALAFLLEQDDTQHGPLYRSYHRARERVGRQIIALAKQFYTEKRKIRILGDNQAWVVKDFDNTDLTGVADVRVRQASSVPMSRAGAMQQVFDIAQAFPQFYTNLTTGQLDQERLAEDLQMGRTKQSLDYNQIDIDHAKRENDLMAEGQPPNPGTAQMQPENPQAGYMPNSYDNNDTHYREHTRFMKTAEYDMLAPQVKQIFMQHLKMTGMVLQKMAQAQQPQPQQPQPQGATV